MQNSLTSQASTVERLRYQPWGLDIWRLVVTKKNNKDQQIRSVKAFEIKWILCWLCEIWSLCSDGSRENISPPQVTNCPSGDKGRSAHRAYQGPWPKWAGLSYNVTVCFGNRDSHRFAGTETSCCACQSNALKTIRTYTESSTDAGLIANILNFK